MTGLLLKDVYLLFKHSKFVILAMIIFSVMPSVDSEFTLCYLAMIASMLPMTVFALDERAEWEKYAVSMAYSKKDLVVEKYILGILTMIFAIILWGALQFFRSFAFHAPLITSDKLVLIPLMLIIAALSQAVFSPFVFWLGIEKARLIYIIGSFASMSGLFNLTDKVPTDISFISPWQVTAVAAVVAIIIFSLSLIISIQIYKKKEL